MVRKDVDSRVPQQERDIYIGDPANNFQNRQLAELSPELVLDGQAPRLIDEWQEVPPLWDAVRYRVDQTPERGQFILTGSATPNHKGILHSGAGRIARCACVPCLSTNQAIPAERSRFWIFAPGMQGRA